MVRVVRALAARWMANQLPRAPTNASDACMEHTHKGGCHCGKVRFEVQGVDLSKPVIACNCSICQRSGSLLAFVPATSFTLVSGEDELQHYAFNTKSIDHLFCKTCGIKSFAKGKNPDGTEMRAINVRCLDDLEDVRKLELHWFDGRSK